MEYFYLILIFDRAGPSAFLRTDQASPSQAVEKIQVSILARGKKNTQSYQYAADL